MKKIVVVYQSKYGATKKYAEWISGELSCDLFERKNVKVSDLKTYDTIIYGGGLYAVGVSGIDIITKNFPELSNKNLIVFTCGLADPMSKENTDDIKENLSKVFTTQMQNKIKLFHLRGAINYAKMGIIHKAMMSSMYKRINKKDYDSLGNEDKEFLSTYGKAVDFTDKSAILPIVQYVREL
ncbi:flavodoxin domain-containing protein [Anaerotignum sp. MB30-C6]|uniref:flavodoxin domain-containing protein n=1 Tax=Anaerotignum sp. MB30-C6 TaxID=3070814 RepID=UPI0027DE57AB|nr:flavodoxin domain-containing protein [Anaerotignum sp. MB30-C6]WMI80015.1 flavodoxin domain-containing protein [Anaerotignum sp. MB30-C6]